MGIPAAVDAVPYKLLVYEPGGFFLEHQDSEKLPGMFGTLLVGLPCAHSGGEIRIDPGNGDHRVFDFSLNDARDFPALAFFADRKHEILPVTDGYRVVLVFNLVYAAGQTPESIDDDALVQELAQTMADLAGSSEPVTLALDHQYTNTNFSTAQLKGNDGVRVDALRRAAKRAGVEIRVGLIEESESAQWENGYQYGQDYDSRYRRGRSRYDDDDDLGPSSPTTFHEVELGESYDGSFHMSNWLPEDGADLGQVFLDPEKIATGPNYKEDEPIDWSVEGYQGNWGMTAQYTYRYAGVMLWHPANTDSVLEKLPLEGQLSWLGTYAAEARQHPADDARQRRVQGLLERIRQQLDRLDQYGPYRLQPVVDALALRGPSTVQLGMDDWSLWEPVFVNSFQFFPTDTWERLLPVFGDERISQVVERVGSEPWGRWSQPSPKRLNALLEVIAHQRREARKAAVMAQEWLQRVPDYLTVHLPKGDADATLLVNLLTAARPSVPEGDWTERVGQHVLRHLNRSTYLHDVLGAVLLNQLPPSSLYDLLHQTTVHKLRERTAARPQPYSDLSRPLPEGMTAPEGPYEGLMRFLMHPEQRVYRFVKAEAERTRMEHYVDRHQLDLDAKTIRKGRPYTLQLTKNDQSYHRAVAQFERDRELLGWLETPGRKN